MRGRAALGGMALAATAGWNVSNVGAVADEMGRSYGVGLGVIGLFTTGLFVTHALMQVPAGRLCDRVGARVVGGSGLLVVAAGSAAALAWHEPWFAIGMRTFSGVGTGAAFVSGSDYVRKAIGTPVAQGLYGASSMAAGGLGLALVPLWGSWQAPFASAVLIALAGVVLVVLAPPEPARPPVSRALPRVTDRSLLPLAAMMAASFGASIILGNWVVTFLHRAGGDSEHAAGIAGALILLAGVVSRPLGGRLVDNTGVLRLSFLGGGAAVGLLAIAKPLPLAVVAAALIGFAAGLPFAACFAGAARLLPEAPGAAVGFVNMFAALTILIGTPLVGLTFQLPGNGRIGLAVIAVVWAATALAVPRNPG